MVARQGFLIVAIARVPGFGFDTGLVSVIGDKMSRLLEWQPETGLVVAVGELEEVHSPPLHGPRSQQGNGQKQVPYLEVSGGA